jgi:hypothetical protein
MFIVLTSGKGITSVGYVLGNTKQPVEVRLLVAKSVVIRITLNGFYTHHVDINKR